jgi:pyruvate dehydrogenase E1 component
VDRWNLLHPTETPRTPYVTQALSGVKGTVVAVTDFMKLVPDQVARWVPWPFVTLGTDGFGRSDARKALRRFFEVDAGHMVAATLSSLASQGLVPKDLVQDAFDRYRIDPNSPDPAHAH